MSQNLERFGVEAVWLDAKFERGVRDYNDAMKKADKETKKATASMSNSFDENQKAIDSWLSNYKRASQQVQQETKKLPRESDKAAKGFKFSFTEIRSAIQLAVGAFRTLANAAAGAFRLAQEGAQQLGQQRSFAIVSGGAEQAAKNLEAMRQATRGTATDAQLMEQALGIIATGLASNEEELFKVTRNVTRLGSVMKGLGAERALLSFQLLATDLEASKARLDDFGLTMEQVKPRLDELVASGLSLQEATKTALLEAMDEQMQALGLTAATAADSFGQVEAAAGNLGDSFKQSLAPAGAVLADALTKALTELDSAEEAFDSLALAAVKAASLITAAFQVITEFEIDSAFDLGRLAAFELAGETDALGRFQEIYNESLKRGEQALNEVSDVADDLGTGMGRVADNTGDATERMKTFSDAIAKSRTQALEAFLKRAIAVERQLEDAAIARARKIEDIERQAAARRAQIEEQFAQTIANLQEQAGEERRQRQINLARQLEQIERNFQERKRAIQAAFAVSFQRAVRSRDALALVEAIRTRNTDLNEAKRQRDQERADATTGAAEEEAEQQRSLQRQIEAARAARAQQIADAQAAQAQQIEDLRRAEERKTEDRARANERWLEDQTRAFNDRRARAVGEYQQDETFYRDHLQRMLNLTNQFIPAIFRSGGTRGALPSRQGGTGRGSRRMAEGGALVANQATQVTFGEAGPELAIFQPLSQISNASPASSQVSGQMRHAVSGEIQASMAGFQGRLTAAVNEAVLRSFREVLR